MGIRVVLDEQDLNDIEPAQKRSCPEFDELHHSILIGTTEGAWLIAAAAAFGGSAALFVVETEVAWLPISPLTT